MSEFQLDPVVINTGEEDDEERRRREAAMRALGDLSAFDAADAAPPVATQAPARAPDLSAFDRAREPVAREHAPPPTQASLLDQGLPPPPGARPVPGVVERRLGRQQGQAQALGDQYRAGTLPGVAQPGQAHIVRGPDGREQGRIYPPGMLPPPVRGDARFSPGAPPDSRVPPPVGQTAPPPAQPPGGALPPNAIGALRGAEGGRPSYMGQAGEAPSREQVRQLIAARSQSPAQRLSVPMGETPAGQQLRALEGQVSSGKKPAGNAPPDYTGADVADAFRRPLHALAAGLRAYAGRPSQPFRSEGAEARARDARTASEKTAQGQRDAEARREDREMSLRERAQSAIEADRTQRAQRLEEQGQALERYRQRTTEIQQALAEGRIDESQARAAEVEARTDVLRQRFDPESAISQRARERFDESQGMRAQITGVELDANTEGLAANDIDALSQDMRQTRSARMPRRGGGGGARTSPQGLTDIPEGWQGTPEQWRDLPQRERVRIIASLGTPTARQRTQGGEGEPASDWTPRGWRDVDGRDLGEPERRSIRNAAAESSRLSGQLRRMQELAREVSASSRIAGRAGMVNDLLAEARSVHENVINGLRAAGNYGVPTGTEMERMERLAPALESASAFVNSGSQYGGILTAHERSMSDWMGSYGIERDAGGGQGAPRSQAGQRAPAQGRANTITLLINGAPRTFPAEREAEVRRIAEERGDRVENP
jgi:hypothetical protein